MPGILTKHRLSIGPALCHEKPMLQSQRRFFTADYYRSAIDGMTAQWYNKKVVLADTLAIFHVLYNLNCLFTFHELMVWICGVFITQRYDEVSQNHGNETVVRSQYVYNAHPILVQKLGVLTK